MPLYEYQCPDCGDEFEKMVPFSAANLTQPCPTCKGQNTKKKISTVAFHGLTKSVASVKGNCAPRGGFS